MSFLKNAGSSLLAAFMNNNTRVIELMKRAGLVARIRCVHFHVRVSWEQFITDPLLVITLSLWTFRHDALYEHFVQERDDSDVMVKILNKSRDKLTRMINENVM